jgi:hypothetical protein
MQLEALDLEAMERATAARWRARAERARRFAWSVGKVDARRLDQYAAECEAEARRLEKQRGDDMPHRASASFS